MRSHACRFAAIVAGHIRWRSADTVGLTHGRAGLWTARRDGASLSL